jgi:hypothetical protein
LAATHRNHRQKAERRQRVGFDEQDRPYDIEIEAVMDTLFRSPGFRLVRRQVGELRAFAREMWNKHFRALSVPLRERTFLPYVRRLSNTVKPKV